MRGSRSRTRPALQDLQRRGGRSRTARQSRGLNDRSPPATNIPASSGLTNRHRLNRSGDRQLNRAMHTITLIRMRLDPSTKTYVARKIAEGKTSRDAQRCLKRVVCRQIFKILERAEGSQLVEAEELAQAA
ncbi:transposase [Streptomyces griseofuscus]|uniref:transposase n=1 Tax=Streptomyces griseofuscus TaxID=146922 RepID=UPI0033D3A0CB